MANRGPFDLIPFEGKQDDGGCSEDEDLAFGAYAMGLFPDATGASSRGGSFIHRTPVRRNIREGWHRLWGDYFSPDKIYSDKIFHRR